MAFGGPAEVLELVQAKRPMLAIDKDEIEVELPQNVDHPWGREGKIVAVSLASGTRGAFDPVGLLHPMSSSVRRLRSDHVILSVFGRCQRPNSAPGKPILQDETQRAEWTTASMRRLRTFPASPRNGEFC